MDNSYVTHKGILKEKLRRILMLMISRFILMRLSKDMVATIIYLIRT